MTRLRARAGRLPGYHGTCLEIDHRPQRRSRDDERSSISSSALASPGEVDLMVALLSAPHRGGEGTFRSIGSHHRQTVVADDVIQAKVLAAGDAFHLPSDPRSR